MPAGGLLELRGVCQGDAVGNPEASMQALLFSPKINPTGCAYDAVSAQFVRKKYKRRKLAEFAASMKIMNYAEIKKVDVANGPGVRVSLFVSGCTHHCPGCFNPETWDFAYGTEFGEAEIEKILTLLAPDYVEGLTILGGEPFEPQNQEAVLKLVKRVRKELPGKSIWCFSGYIYEFLADGKIGEHSRELLRQLDVLVDGPFVMKMKDLKLKFRGSSNQRIIDVPASLKAGKAIPAGKYMV